MYCCIYLLYHLIYQYAHFLILKSCINLSTTIDFSSLCFEYISISLSYNHDVTDLLYNSLPLFSHILFSLCLNSSQIFWKALVIVIPFISFKEIIHVYLLKISITHNQKQIPLLNLLVNFISAKSAQQILFIKHEYTFLFLNILIIGLCNSSNNSLL